MALKEPFYVVATLNPVPGKAQEVLTGIKPFIEHIKANEPGCLQFEISQPAGADADSAPITFIELWKDMAALEEHRQTDKYEATTARIQKEGWLTGPLEIRLLQPVGGFGPRA